MPFLSTLLSIIKHPRLLVPFGFTLGGFFLYLTIRGIDWAEVREQLADTALTAVAGSPSPSCSSPASCAPTGGG